MCLQVLFVSKTEMKVWYIVLPVSFSEIEPLSRLQFQTCQVDDFNKKVQDSDYDTATNPSPS